MQEYHKIQSLFKRDPAKNNKSFILGDWSCPEFGYLADAEWVCTEKVDGMNIRVLWDGEMVIFKGRTEKVQIPATLFAVLLDMFPPRVFAGKDPMCLYGEGYGAKIQKAGALYRPDQSFILFDVRVGDWWLKEPDLWDVSMELGIDLVPAVSRFSLYSAINAVANGFPSCVNGNARAEGMVLRPTVQLFDRAGHRIIAKIKTNDFRAEVEACEGRWEYPRP